MKICFVTSTYPRDQEDVAVPWMREHVKRLRKMGHEVHVFAPSFEGMQSHRIDAVPVHRFRYWLARGERLTHDSGAPNKVKGLRGMALSGIYTLAGAVALARLHRRERFDVLHVHWPFPHAVFAAFARRAFPTCVVLNYHGAELQIAERMKAAGKLLHRANATADAVVANSSFTAAKAGKFGASGVTVIPYGSPIAERDFLPPSNEEKRILFVGRLIERKGIEYLIRAFPAVLAQQHARLVIVGQGLLGQSLHRLVEEMGLEGSVTFRTDLPEQELAKEYEQADVFVLPAIIDSRGDTEGLGVVLIEALSFLKPVIASNVGGIPDVIRHEQTGLLVPEKSPEALAEAILKFLDNPEYARRIAEEGRRDVAERFDWDRIATSTISLYHRAQGHIYLNRGVIEDTREVSLKR